jgi:hypothetical protein
MKLCRGAASARIVRQKGAAGVQQRINPAALR